MSLKASSGLSLTQKHCSIQSSRTKQSWTILAARVERSERARRKAGFLLPAIRGRVRATWHVGHVVGSLFGLLCKAELRSVSVLRMFFSTFTLEEKAGPKINELEEMFFLFILFV